MNTTSPLITVTDAWRLYGSLNQDQALAGATLAVDKGEFVCLAGPSGSGKTTLLNLIGLLDLPDKGQITIMGHDTMSLTLRQRAIFRRCSLGFIFQAYNLIPVLSVAENVEYPLILRGKEKQERAHLVERALKLVEISQHALKRPGELSGGQQQRVAVARAIAGSPPIILADEPTGSLDSGTGTALMNLLLRLNQQLGITFIFSSHDPNVTSRAQRIITLRDGKVAHELTETKEKRRKCSPPQSSENT
ncbi:MAG: ABC transporter ATP-binding protein [Proteobacteria bacterium]|nr:ABC transporter ATP-binding protein [Desulfobulbaceae bacterium]MBU4152673.1 ABC transporter ATP-binding protein [Pseudomonadota bacterium]